MGKGMVIGSIRLPKKDIYKHTRTSPGGRFRNQIGHVVINKIHKLTITNGRSYNGTDSDTDHYLVITDFKLKLASRWCSDKPNRLEKINVKRLKSKETCNKYQNVVADKLKLLENNSIEIGSLVLQTVQKENTNINS